tara:strand:+ start:705 stop:1454 length:750 start_codon:yes stop_codon:yes gene_type:complete
MAGHSKFKNIMHRKGAQDKKRAKEFSRLGREISVAVKVGGDDPESNNRLRSAITSAKGLNMPKDNIERAIKKGQGNDPDSNYEDVRYEGYGPAGVAIIVEALTNNKNRTAAEIRSTFSKFGGNLGETGSVSFSFERLGNISLNKSLVNEEDLFDFLIDNETDDYDITEDNYVIYCDQNRLHDLNDKIIQTYGQTNYSNLIWKSKNNININKETAVKLFKLLEILEDNDDVQGVSSNFEVDEAVMSSLTS